MSQGDNEESRVDWAPKRRDADSEFFKWGWSATEGGVVWKVSGAGDGLPGHLDQLTAAWGREPSFSAGDALGIAEYVPSDSDEGTDLVIRAYYDGPFPQALVDWFRSAFPDARLRLVGAD